jgi:hypothetical protein
LSKIISDIIKALPGTAKMEQLEKCKMHARKNNPVT